MRLKIALPINIHELIHGSTVEFDDRINHHASIDDLSLAEILIFLQDVKSDLFHSALSMEFADLLREMQIARGANEDLRPVNVGLLFFCEDVEKFFPYTRIEVNIYHDDIGDSFTEKVFKGAIHQQLRKALSYIKAQVIEEHVQKVEGQAEAIRFYNYPFQAIEEALANAVYHKSYEIREPIEVNLRLDQIEILSHAGPMLPVSRDDLKKERIITRKYLNRRIGDFLRELHLTEGKGTGIPKIRRAMRNNGSQEPIFETDDDRSFFLTILHGRTGDRVGDESISAGRPPDTAQTGDRLRPITTDYDRLTPEQKSILDYMKKRESVTRREALTVIDVGETKLKEIFNSLIDQKLIVRVGKGRSVYYRLTDNKPSETVDGQ